jgi:hypothetical protein
LEVGDYFVVIANDNIKTSSVGFWIFNVHKEVACGTLERHIDAYG